MQPPQGQPRLHAVEGGEEPQSLDLCALTEQALSLLRKDGWVRDGEVQLELPHEPVLTRAIRGTLELLLVHLIGQAAQAPKSTRALSVRVTVEPQDIFGDYGPTLRVRHLEDSQPVQVRAPDGLGVARVLAESLGGQLSVRNRGPMGTTISVELQDADDAHATSW
jgi:C4-dicarboxylate-specific signal transduction histidine kinase